MSPVSSDPLSCFSARGVFNTRGGPPLSFLQNLRPSPRFVLLRPPLPTLVSLGEGVLLVGGRKEVFGMELAGVLGEVRNPGHPSCRL